MKSINLDILDPIQIDLTEFNNHEIAIIGMSGKIGSCNNLMDFWQCLLKGEDLICQYPKARRLNDQISLLDRSVISEEPQYYEAAFLSNIDQFDYNFFGISPKEAEVINPHQRLFLENIWSTIEDAGYGGGQLTGSNTGVYLGLMSDSGDAYKEFAVKSNPSMAGVASVGNMNSIIAGRVSYLFDFHGPSIMVDTACSSSLTAVHLACQALRAGECELAIAGSVKIELLPLDTGNADIGIISTDRRTKSFTDNSDGTGSGEGVCSILLKPYLKAWEDGDQIYAVIKGSAINQDGQAVGLTAPNSIAQEMVITKAWLDADINPETITYIEAHGTGTKLGDPIEISGLQRAFRQYTNKKQFCAIGSVKTNIGHLDHAAGIVGLIKATLACKYKELPPSLHFVRPNRKIDFLDSPIYVNDRLTKWETNDYPRRAGISSFGLSGTNCHVVIEEAPNRTQTVVINEWGYFLTLSAQYQEGIGELLKCYNQIITAQPDVNLTDLCFTVNKGRNHYSHRLFIIFFNIDDLAFKLQKIMTANTLETVNVDGVYYGRHKIITDDRTKSKATEVTQSEVHQISSAINNRIRSVKPDQRLAVEIGLA
ncbi:type I polyketide synthase, partial [Lacrimispora brassicae]